MKYFIASVAILAIISISYTVDGKYHCKCETEYFKGHGHTHGHIHGHHANHTKDVILAIGFKDMFTQYTTYENCTKEAIQDCSKTCLQHMKIILRGTHDTKGHYIHKFKQTVKVGSHEIKVGTLSCNTLKHAGKTPVKAVHMGIFSSINDCGSNVPHKTGLVFNDTLTCDDAGQYVPH